MTPHTAARPHVEDSTSDHAADPEAIAAVIADIETGFNANDPELSVAHFAEPSAGPAGAAAPGSITTVASVAHPHLDRGEYVALQGAAGWRAAVELIGGEAVVTPPARAQAASAQGELFYALRRWQETSGDGGLLLQDVFIRLSGEHYLAPDIAWWAIDRRPPLAQGALDLVPDLVVEVLSPATRTNDLGVKRDVYLAAGARELWLADPDSATLTAARPDDRDDALGRGDRLTSPLLPGFGLDVAQVFVTPAP